jgi:YVTN family beta-propeller protein
MRSAIAIFLLFTACATSPSAPHHPLLLVVNQGSQTLSFVDAATLTVTKSIPMSPAPHELVLSPDRRTAYVSLYGNREVVGDRIAVIDIAAQKETGRLSLNGKTRPHGMATRDDKLYVTSESSQSVVRLDRTGSIDWTGDTSARGSHMLALTADGKRVYTGNIGSDSLSVIDITSSHSVASKQIAVGKGPEGIAMSPDGREVWAAHRGGGGVSVIDTSRDEVVATILPAIVSARVTFTPDGRNVLLFDGPSSSLVIVDRASRTEVGRVVLPGNPGGGIVSADSRTAYVSIYGPFEVAKIDLAKKQITGSVETGIAPDGMALIE